MFFLLLLIPSLCFAHTITLRMEYNLTSNDDVHVGSNYVARNTSGVLGALIFAGDILIDLGQSKITQDERNNRFLFALTKSSYSNFADKVNSVGRMLAGAFAPMGFSATAKLYLVLSYLDVNIVNAERIGKGFQELLIRNSDSGRVVEVLK
jgi:hypothetical protein